MKKNVTIFIIQQADFGISKLPPATKDEISSSEFNMKKAMPNELIDFYMEVSNGMTFGRLHIFPVLSKKNLKKTGNSIARNNSVEHSHWFNGDELSIKNFLVFCAESSHTCFAFRSGSDFIWQWNRGEGEALELDYKFWDWLYESLVQEKHYLFK